MKLPDNADSFVDSVFKTGKQLIDQGFWEIQTSRFDGWVSQFCGKEEQFFAACLLDQTIIRSRPQFESALRSLFRSNVNHTIFRNHHDLRLTEVLRFDVDPRVRLVPVICETDPPTKSGPLVLRRLQRLLQLRAKWMCWPWQAQDAVDQHGVDTIIFVDDFLGSGDQFSRFFDQWGFQQHTDLGVTYVYAPVVAHDNGLKFLSSIMPTVTVECSEKLGYDHSFFRDCLWEQLSHGQISGAEAPSVKVVGT